MTLRTLLQGTRLGDVLPWGGVALLGAMQARGGWQGLDLATAVAGVLTVLGLALFAFLFNDLCDRNENRRENRPDRSLASGAFPLWLGIGLAGSGAALALTGPLVLGNSFVMTWSLASLALGAAYSAPWPRLKCRAGLASLTHVIQGTLAFALPAWLARGQLDPAAAVAGVWFGLVFAAGHLHHEVLDLAADQAAGTRTLAVRRGGRTALWLGFALFASAAIWSSWLALAGRTASWWGWTQLGMFLAYAMGFAYFTRGRPDPAGVRRLRQLYRISYLAGGALLLAASWHGGAG
ncbi:MAG: UbiA family prenyltransferase [Myxococcales bacterium]|nr:UbiA family prenyltransferase [Myxococcales bacterium]